MGFYIDRHNRRKSTLALTSFVTAIGLLFLFLILYLLLAEPLEASIRLSSVLSTNIVHSLLISIIGTAIGCLLFLLPDKHIAPYGFFTLGMLLLTFYAAALTMGEGRTAMLQLITLFGLLPVIVGNAVTWPIYMKMKHEGLVSEHKKTITEELKEAIEKDRQRGKQTAPAESKASAAAEPEAAPASDPVCEAEVLFGPETNGSPRRGPSAQEEAMLLFTDDEDDT